MVSYIHENAPQCGSYLLITSVIEAINAPMTISKSHVPTPIVLEAIIVVTVVGGVEALVVVATGQLSPSTVTAWKLMHERMLWYRIVYCPVHSPV